MEYLIDIGENYLKSFLNYLFDKLKDTLTDIIKKLNYEDVIDIKNMAKELGKAIIINFSEILEKNEYKNDEIYKEFDINRVKSLINEIFKQEAIDDNIKLKIKKDLKDFRIENNYSNMINILLIGKESKEKNKFMEIISKIFNISNENIINIEFKEYFNKIKFINIINYNNNDNLNNNINCIWYFIEEEIQNNDIKNIKTDNLSNNIPIIYIHFKDIINKEKKQISSNLNISNENINNNYYYIFENHHIIDINKINEQFNKNINCKLEIKEYFLNLIEKSILNILIKDNEFKIETKYKNILDIIDKRTKNFAFGNKINNLSNFNYQIVYKIFKEFLFEKDLPKSVKKNIKKILHYYQKYLESLQNSYFSLLFSRIKSNLKDKYRNMKNDINLISLNKIYKDNEEDLKFIILRKIYDQTILYIDTIEVMNDDDKNEKSNIIKVKSSYSDDINIIIKNILEDYFLNKSSIFINELIINIIKEKIINIYNNEYLFVLKQKREEEI